MPCEDRSGDWSDIAKKTKNAGKYQKLEEARSEFSLRSSGESALGFDSVILIPEL